MKKYYALLLLSLMLLLQAYSQTTVIATWMSGDNIIDQPGVYGTKGVSTAENKPGGRSNASSWMDTSGNLWLFGGGLHDPGYVSLSDLWKYELSTNQWTWVGGDRITNQPAVHGTKGIASTANHPGGRSRAVSWTDAAGKFWLFGGHNNLNDLWKYDPSTGEWTWMSGDNVANQPGVYGAKGIPSVGNNPGARADATGWTDAAGNLWLFGGEGFANSNSAFGLLNDLWRYNPTTSEWTWMSGDNTVNQSGIYGTKGMAAAANMPGARADAISWTDAAGCLWLFGGWGLATDNSDNTLNDLWKYDPSTGEWTWMSGDNVANQPGVYGAKGIPSVGNNPGARADATGWTDAAGNLWLFGGGIRLSFNYVSLGDLWKYELSTNQWTWVGGDSTANQEPYYGLKGIPSSFNQPRRRVGALNWWDTEGNFWIFGGYYLFRHNTNTSLNDLWKFSFSDQPLYVFFRDADGDSFGNPNDTLQKQEPSAPAGYVTDYTDCDDNNILYSDKDGDGHGAGTPVSCGGVTSSDDYDDHDPLIIVRPTVDMNVTATWMSGDNRDNQPGIYGTKGVAAPQNKPGARDNAVSWTDDTGNFWLFGGEDYTSNGITLNARNDLWKYDPRANLWTWMSGDSTLNQSEVYGTKGIASAENKPGAISNDVSWQDASGNFWLLSNVLWKYNLSTNEWTWMSGDSASGLKVYGTKGVPSIDNFPGRKRGAVGWTDTAGNLWLFGGYYFFNDLWKYSPSTNEWTWVSGENYPWPGGIYGTKGVPSQTNHPGSREDAAGWTDTAGNLWLFGGTTNGSASDLNDLWKYNPSTGEWVWVSGSNIPNQPGVYGAKGIPSAGNIPNGRLDAVTWTDAAGNLWLFGGRKARSNPANGLHSFYDDLWRYNPTTNQWTWMSGNNVTGSESIGNTIPARAGVYGTKGVAAPTNRPGVRSGAVGWRDLSGNLWLFGGYWQNMPNRTTISNGFFNDLWRFTLDSTFAALTTAPVQAGPYCTGSTLQIGFSTEGNFSAGNVFTAQLSDSAGSFDSPVNIGTIGGTASGSLAVTIPANTPSGTAYRIRVVASSPAAVGTDNGSNLSITGLPTITVSGGTLSSGLSYRYYEGSFTQLPDFGGLKAVASGTVNNISLAPRKRDEQFAFLFEGSITIPRAGRYYFETSSDDGSRLYIGNYGHYITPVVDNDGQHGLQTRGGWYTFKEAGTYAIAVAYFEQGGDEQLKVYWGSDDAGIPMHTPIPDVAFGPPPSAASTLTYAYYEGSWTQLPDFGGLIPVETGHVTNITLSPRKRDEQFAFLFKGRLIVPRAGWYYLETESDDGSRLYIGNYGHYITPVVDNDGQHAALLRGGWYRFPAARQYDIAVTFFEQSGAEQLKVYWGSDDAGIPMHTPIPDVAFATGVVGSCSNSMLTASEGDTYLWSTGETTRSITATQTGSYTVTVTKDGCAASSEPVLVTCIDNSLSQKVGEKNGGVALQEQATAGQLSVRVLPNPSTTHFTLHIDGTAKQSVTIRVIDLLGRVVETKTTTAITGAQVGTSLRPGTYFAHVVQGSKKVTVKLVKTIGL